MNLKIHDLMVENVITAAPEQTAAEVRALMETNHIHAVPVVGPDGEALGVVSATDFLSDPDGSLPVRDLMTGTVHAVPAYNDVHVAARVMRNHRIHHVVVTHEKRVVGILSSFDLLKLVEEHRFVMKTAPGAKKAKASR